MKILWGTAEVDVPFWIVVLGVCCLVAGVLGAGS